MNPAQYAEQAGVQTRTVERWLAAGELPAASKVNGRWHIPSDAARTIKLNGNSHTPTPDMSSDMSSDMSPTRRGDVGVSVQVVTLADALDKLPALLSLEQASRLLGIPETAIRRNAEKLSAVPWGPRGTLVIPARVVRQLAGL
jgi:hypothetical protein